MEFSVFLQSLGIRHSRTALYSPQSNAEAERLKRVLKDGIKAALADGKSFRDGVRQTLAAYRTIPHSTTGVSPSSLMLAFPVRMTLSVLSPSGAADKPTYKADLRPALTVLFAFTAPTSNILF